MIPFDARPAGRAVARAHGGSGSTLHAARGILLLLALAVGPVAAEDAAVCQDGGGQPKPQRVLLQAKLGAKSKAKSRRSHHGRGTPDVDDALFEGFGPNDVSVAAAALLEASPSFDVEGVGTQVCGTRPMLPQLQFELEVFRRLGFLEAAYARCRVPSIRMMALRMPLGSRLATSADTMYASLDVVLGSKHGSNKQHRDAVARVVAFLFVAAALLAVVSHISAAFSPAWEHKKERDAAKKLQPGAAAPAAAGFRELQEVWHYGASQWLGASLSWLEPIVGRVAWTGAGAFEGDLTAGAPELHVESYVAFRRVWQQEVKGRGLHAASLATTAWRFLGPRPLVWTLFSAGAAATLELAAMTVVLDMLLNYLHMANAVRYEEPLAGESLDLLRPVVMFIGFGFGVPMLARICGNMAALCDTQCADRLTAGMLTVIYEKSQHLAIFEDRDSRPEVVDFLQMLTTDIRKMWAGALTSGAQLLIYPTCAGMLLTFLSQQLGIAGLLGALSSCWVALLYFPIWARVSHGHTRWGRLANSRLSLLQEAMTHVRLVKAMALAEPLTERIGQLREEELQTRFQAAMVQTLLDVPVSLFPFILAASTLFFCHTLAGGVSPGAIFTCMQVLSALMYCTPRMAAALQKSVSLPVALRRVQRFLQEPEASLEAARRPLPSPQLGAPHLRLQGSFAVANGHAPVLRDLDVQVRRGEMVAVIGGVGSGKSSLLHAMLGALHASGAGSFVQRPQGGAILCSQEPWVVDGTLRENVILDDPQDTDRLYDALDAAALLRDSSEGELPQLEEGAKPEADGGARRRLQIREPEESTPDKYKFPYFAVWNVCAFGVCAFSVYNVDWKTTRPSLGIFVAAVQSLLHWSVLEFPIQTIATLMTKPRKLAKADSKDITIVLNYNVLATSQGDVDECMENMLEAYLENLHENVSAVLVSATNDASLKEYELQVRNDHRARIYKDVYRSGLAFAGFVEGARVKEGWRRHIWSKYAHLDKVDFVQNHLPAVCEHFCREYMVLHRVSRVLRKCGQYQDLILLSSGDATAFTYTDPTHYNRAARKADEPLFKPSEDTDNVNGRNFDYTLVLDSDTRVEPYSVFRMLEVAAAYPEKAIVQPAIKMDCGPEDSIFMHLEATRQRVYDPMNRTMTSLLGKSSFFGKGLIKNSVYTKYCLGTRDRPIESVPIDVLSHDTFEAAVLNPLYISDVFLLEAPCHNYITWDIRERRWNLGEMLLAGYFWPTGVGKPVRYLQKKFQGAQRFNETVVRTKTKLDKVSSYFAHSALRQMVLKPMLLVYIIVMHFVHMKWQWAPFITVMFAIIVFPKLATCTRNNYKDVIMETGASILQFTPEAIVGTIRVFSALKAHLAGAATWVPQRAVEEESKVSNPFVFAIRYLWYYSLFALVWGLRVGIWNTLVGPEAMFIITILGTLFMLPVYVGFTSLPANTMSSILGQKRQSADKEEDAADSLPQSDTVLHAFRLRLARMRLASPEGFGTKKLVVADVAKSAAELQLGLRGVRLSPGEGCRLALARAAYSRRSNLVLVDDPFSAIDAATAHHVLQRLLCGPLMRGRTRVVAAPPSAELLQHFDRVLLLASGRIVEDGTPRAVVATATFRELLAATGATEHAAGAASTSGDAGWELAVPGRSASSIRSRLRLAALAGGSALPAVQQEEQQLPDWRRVCTMLGAAAGRGGICCLLAAVLSLVCFRVALQGQVLLLGQWADRALRGERALGGQPLLAAAALLVMCVCQVFAGYASLSFNSHVSRRLFDDALASLLRAPLDSCWDRQPVGRLVGRFAGDVLTVDGSLATGLMSLAGVAVDLLLLQLYCFVLLPWTLVAPTYIIVACFCKVFWSTALRLQLFSAMALSRCQEDQAQQSAKKAALRLSVHAFQYHNRLAAQYCANAGLTVLPESLASHAKLWVVTRITFCLCFQSTACVLYSIMVPEQLGVGAVAIIITATFHIVHQLGGLVDSLLAVASLGISLQRLSALGDLPQEAPEHLPDDEQVRRRLLAAGGLGLRLEALEAGYGGGVVPAVPVLRGASLTVLPRQRALLLGAAGAGKSTALQCIVRLLEPHAGRVALGGVDAQQLGLRTLRELACLVPQKPVFFRGPLRFNVDPHGRHSDERILEALRNAQLLPLLERWGPEEHLEQDLDPEGATTLSFGQQQLLGLARAICQRPPLLLLDDCISALDPSTRGAAYEAALASCPASTVLVAAQRADGPLLRLVGHVAVLEGGVVVRQGPPSQMRAEGLGQVEAP